MASSQHIVDKQAFQRDVDGVKEQFHGITCGSAWVKYGAQADDDQAEEENKGKVMKNSEWHSWILTLSHATKKSHQCVCSIGTIFSISIVERSLWLRCAWLGRNKEGVKETS